MDAQVLIIRFPNGDAEFYAGRLPSVGDRLVRNDAEWVVCGVAANSLGGTSITVTATNVIRDKGWPDPYGFIWS
jgi:hypothetical protein